ncbi:MAG: hypothetical protein ACREXY_04830 [Gammaproteobacteria bacterium]
MQAYVREMSLHGILAARDAKLMGQIGEAEIVLEMCRPRSCSPRRSRTRTPSATPSAPSPSMGCRSRSPPTGPEIMRTHLRDEFELLLRAAVDESQLVEANRRGQQPNFVH